MPQESTRTEAGQGRLALFKAVGRGLSNPEVLTWLFVAVGVSIRVAEYTDNRGLYMDERALLKNLVGLSVFDFTTRLSESQLAPPGFLVVERAMVRLPGSPVWWGRLIPVLCGIASMFLMRSVGRRYLSPRAVPIAVGLFALDDWVVYYAAELKQYSGDIMLTLMALLIAAGREDNSPGEAGRARRLALAAFGVVGVWFSYSLALVLGAVGTYLAGAAAIRRDWKRLQDYAVISLLWAISFVACFQVSHWILSTDRFIWDWWHFAFLPIPPRSVADLTRTGWQLLNVFHSPAWVVTPLGVLASAFLALALYVIGAGSLLRRSPGELYLLLGPVVFTIVASALGQYPFHGRLLLFLVPTVHLLVGEGAAAVARPGGATLTAVLAVLLLIQPTGDAVWNRFVMRRFHGAQDSHGDLHPDLLDYLERPRRNNPTVRPFADNAEERDGAPR